MYKFSRIPRFFFPSSPRNSGSIAVEIVLSLSVISEEETKRSIFRTVLWEEVLSSDERVIDLPYLVQERPSAFWCPVGGVSFLFNFFFHSPEFLVLLNRQRVSFLFYEKKPNWQQQVAVEHPKEPQIGFIRGEKKNLLLKEKNSNSCESRKQDSRFNLSFIIELCSRAMKSLLWRWTHKDMCQKIQGLWMH